MLDAALNTNIQIVYPRRMRFIERITWAACLRWKQPFYFPPHETRHASHVTITTRLSTHAVYTAATANHVQSLCSALFACASSENGPPRTDWPIDFSFQFIFLVFASYSAYSSCKRVFFFLILRFFYRGEKASSAASDWFLELLLTVHLLW